MSKGQAVDPRQQDAFPATTSPFITTADERLAEPPRMNIVITGASGVGKTTLARTLPAATTLFVDLEAGTRALADWGGDIFKVREVATKLKVHPWELSRAIACVMCGPDPAADPGDLGNPYSAVNYQTYCKVLGGENVFDKYQYVFWDSATVAGRHCLTWCAAQPQAFSEKTGKPDNRGMYGLHGQEIVKWLTNIQHIKNKSTVIAAIMNEDTDDLKGTTYSLQIDGSKVKAELPGIFDTIATLAIFKDTDGRDYRALVCTGINNWGFLAKDRGGNLSMTEPPDLMRLITKSSSGARNETLVSTIPADAPGKPNDFNPNRKD